MMKKISVLFFLMQVAVLSLQGQIIEKNHFYPEPVSRSIEFYYFGLDISLCTLVNDRRLDQGQELRDKYGKDFYIEFEKRVNFKTLSRWLLKDQVYYHPHQVQEKWIELPDNWVQPSAKSISVDQIHEHIMKYDLAALEGLAFVIIPFALNKYTEKVSCYFVFFDLKTRDILWATTAQGAAGGGGFVGHWVTGMVTATRQFIDKDYKITARKFR